MRTDLKNMRHLRLYKFYKYLSNMMKNGSKYAQF